MSISVYITSYNQKDYLIKALKSALNQTHSPKEIIIVDDHSSDGSIDVIESYENKYPNLIRAIYNETNVGISKVRQIAIEHATGDYITALDGDDLFEPRKLEEEFRIMNSSNCDIVFSNHQTIDPEGNFLEIWVEPDSVPPEGSVFKEVFTRQFPKNRLFRSELIRRELFKIAGPYDENLKIYEDYDMRIRLSKIGSAKYCAKNELVI